MTDIEKNDNNKFPSQTNPSTLTLDADRLSLTPSDLEKLGRARPAAFSSTFREIIFCSSLLISMLMAEFFISGFNIILPDVSHALSIPEGSQTWPASIFSLVTGSFLLVFGRVADMYGAYAVFTGGLVWFMLWTFLGGFSKDHQLLIATRALAGLGPAAFLPSTIIWWGRRIGRGRGRIWCLGCIARLRPLGFSWALLWAGQSRSC